MNPSRPPSRLASTRCAVAAAGLLLALPAQAEPCPTVALLRLGDGVRILAGERGASDSPCDPAAPAGQFALGMPAWTRVATRRTQGSWTSLKPLPAAEPGLPLMHRSMPWTLGLGGLGAGQIPYYKLLPLTAELGLTGGRIDCIDSVQDVAVARIDDWTFVLVEQDLRDAVLLRRIESAGPSIEMEIERQETWLTGWPAGTRLIGVDGWEPGGELVAFGREGGGAIRVARLPPAPAPALPMSATSSAAGAALMAGPAVVEVRGAELLLHVLDDQGWREAGRVAMPASNAPGDADLRAGAIALVAMDEARRQAVAGMATPSGDVLVAVHDGQAWVDARVLPDGHERSPSVPAPVDRDGEPARDRGAVVVLGLAALVALAAAVVAAYHVRLRMLRG